MQELVGKVVGEARTLLKIGPALRALRTQMKSGNVTPTDLDRTRMAWDNGLWVPSAEFLATTIDACKKSRATVVECGSGLSTAVIALALQGSDREFVTLEHHGTWARRTRLRMNAAGIRHPRILHRPLEPHGDWSWYSVSSGDIPGSIGLVVCDGPPADTPGGRSGMLTILKPYLDTEPVIILDDVDRRPEFDAANTWAHELGSTLEVSDADEDGRQFAVIHS